MRTLLISYDLAEPYRNKHKVVRHIMTLGSAWARPLEQTWYVRTASTEDDVEKRLAPLLASDDGLIVQAIRDEAAMTNTTLRWFKPRAAMETSDADDRVVAFPRSMVCPDRDCLPALAAAC